MKNLISFDWKRLHQPVVVLTLVLVQTAIAWAQAGATAQLSGTLTDASGAAVTKASVTAHHKATGFTRTVRSSDTGYILSNLPPGAYEVTVEAQGFAHLQDPSVVLIVGQQATLNFELKVAGPAEVITVNQSPNVVEPTRTELSQAIEEQRIQNLAINGRQFLDFVLLTPNAYSGRSNLGSQARPGEPDQYFIRWSE